MLKTKKRENREEGRATGKCERDEVSHGSDDDNDDLLHKKKFI